jgi:hypothetical protein
VRTGALQRSSTFGHVTDMPFVYIAYVAMVKMSNNLVLHGKMEGGAAGYYMTHFW